MNAKDIENALFLRAMEPGDDTFLYQIENREEAFLLGENRIPFSQDYLRRFIYASLQENFFSSGQLRLLVCRKSDPTCPENEIPQPVGIIDLFNYEALHQRAETGIVVCQEHRRQGMGEKILELTCAYAKNQLNLHQLYAEVRADNPPSLSLFEKCGFVRCAYRKDWFRQGNRWTDVIGFQKILN